MDLGYWLVQWIKSRRYQAKYKEDKNIPLYRVPLWGWQRGECLCNEKLIYVKIPGECP